MNIGKCRLSNFGSYDEFDFDFDNLGLALITGATGSGKSTMLDAVCWVLYGITAKNGSADDVRSWFTKDPTSGHVTVQTQSDTITVSRIRGGQGKNDLYYTDSSGVVHRGKDIIETQRNLEATLGVSAELYLTAAYFQEFSDTGNFFTANAKARRDMFERIADLSFPMKVTESATKLKKESKAAIDRLEYKKSGLEGQRMQAERELARSSSNRDEWNERQARLIQDTGDKSESYVEDKIAKEDELIAKIDRYNSSHEDPSTYEDLIMQYTAERENLKSSSKSHCESCRQPIRDRNYDKKLEELTNNIRSAENRIYTLNLEANYNNSNLAKLKALEDETNPYIDQLKRARNETNPLLGIIFEIRESIKEINKDIATASKEYSSLLAKVSDLDHLIEISATLRGMLLTSAIKEIEDSTNHYLYAYFDSELRVIFNSTDSDKLDIDVRKNGFDCNFKQLSKGQRQLLRLCFSLSVMEVASNKAGVSFNCLFFDEALDGLDSTLKNKAWLLFQDLSKLHSSILLIEHSQDFQNLFDNKYECALIGDNSSITKVI